MRAAVKSLLLVALAGLALALGAAAPASAATPCWRLLINDWFDGKIDKTYAPECYTQAIKHLPRDVDMYSGAKDDIHRAMLAAIRQGNGGNGGATPAQPSDPTTRSPLGNVEPTQTSPEGHSKGVILRAIEWLGPSDAASVPLPLLILAAVAFLLLAAAGGSFVNRRLQERRLPPPPQA
jgi:hypothetical protein